MNRSLRVTIAGAVTALTTILVTAPAQAAASTPRFAEVIQVSDRAGDHPAIVDSNVVNAWGLALGPTTPLWVANNGTGTATVYRGGVNGAPVTNAGLVVAVPGAPTGQAFNDTADFVVTGPAGSGPARFLFVNEQGDLAGWSPAADPTHAVVAAHVDGAVYKGLALLRTSRGVFLLAADFAGGRIDVFDRSFHRLSLPSGSFCDRRLPMGYAPFNILTVGTTVYVTYAKQQPGSTDEQHGPGLGIVDRYTDFGTEVERIASHGTLNAPWGLAVAPAGFGRFTGALLVGNFGDGRINAFRGDDFLGQLRGTDGHRITIDGLWALLPGTATTGGVGTLWFSAGPDDESHGQVGQIIPASR